MRKSSEFHSALSHFFLFFFPIKIYPFMISSIRVLIYMPICLIVAHISPPASQSSDFRQSRHWGRWGFCPNHTTKGLPALSTHTLCCSIMTLNFQKCMGLDVLPIGMITVIPLENISNSEKGSFTNYKYLSEISRFWKILLRLLCFNSQICTWMFFIKRHNFDNSV